MHFKQCSVRPLHKTISETYFQIGIDFFASASSPNRPLEIIHPSIGSICNDTRLMRNETDFENLLEEFQQFPHEKMLKVHGSALTDIYSISTSFKHFEKKNHIIAHSASRKLVVDSSIKISQVIAMRIYLSRYTYKI